MIPYLPMVMLVFGFVFTVVLQAWFVRRIARLSGQLQDRRETHAQLSKDLARISEEVATLRQGIDSNTVSVANLEREIEDLQKRKQAFLAEHGERLKALAQAEGGTQV